MSKTSITYERVIVHINGVSPEFPVNKSERNFLAYNIIENFADKASYSLGYLLVSEGSYSVEMLRYLCNLQNSNLPVRVIDARELIRKRGG